MLSTPSPSIVLRLLAVSAVLLLAGCEIPGLIPDPRIAQREAEAQAIGGACRHAQRGPEDCFALNPKAFKSAVFAGWKDMDQYMRENKIEGSPPQIGKAGKPDSDESANTAETAPRAAASGRSPG